jgi:hypothetical protein
MKLLIGSILGSLVILGGTIYLYREDAAYSQDGDMRLFLNPLSAKE